MLDKMKSHVIVINVMLLSTYANGAQNDSYSKIWLWALDFYEVIVDGGEAHIDYHPP